MVAIKVQYDAYNRQFKLVDAAPGCPLEDGETYMLLADGMLNDLETDKKEVALESHL